MSNTSDMSGTAQAVRSALQEAQAEGAKRTERAELDAGAFEDFLAGIVREVIRHVVDVRAGKLKPEEASELDDATVRTLAQILMGEHEKLVLKPGVAGPKPGPELVSEMLRNLPSLFRDLPPGSLAGNPRPLMVHAARVFLKEIYAMLRAAAAEGTELSEERLRLRIGRLSSVWVERFLGDSLGAVKSEGTH